MRLPLRELPGFGFGDVILVPDEPDARHVVLLLALISASILALAARKPPTGRGTS